MTVSKKETLSISNLGCEIARDWTANKSSDWSGEQTSAASCTKVFNGSKGPETAIAPFEVKVRFASHKVLAPRLSPRF
jgi:hypothetical protein